MSELYTSNILKECSLSVQVLSNTVPPYTKYNLAVEFETFTLHGSTQKQTSKIFLAHIRYSISGRLASILIASGSCNAYTIH